MLNIQVFEQGLLGSNTILVWDDASCEGLIIDCGNHPEAIKTFAACKGVKVKYIVLSHGHYDHVDYVREYVSAFAGAMIVCHAAEKPVLTDSEANVSELFGKSNVYPLPDLELDEGESLVLGETELVCIHTPGHTPGSMCLYCEEESLMFTGDTLFNMGYGRTDFKHGNEQALMSSLVRLLKMPPETVFYSGHGGASTIGAQRAFYWM